MNLESLVSTVEEYLADYNEDTKTPMKLVMFLDAIEHVSRIRYNENGPMRGQVV